MFLSLKALYDTILFFTLGWRCYPRFTVIQLAWVIPYLIISIVLIRYLVKSLPNEANVVFYSIVLLALYFSSSMAILLISSIFSEVSTTTHRTVKY